MSTIVDASIAAEEFALDDTIDRHPSARFEVGRAIATAADDVMPFLWASGAPVEDLHESLVEDSTTESVELMSRFDDEFLFAVEWTGRVQMPFDAILGRDGAALLDASTNGRQWCFRLVYPDDPDGDAVEDAYQGLGLDFQVDRVYSLSDAFARDHFQLTEKQYETILAAYEAGYYDIPREINLKELARELDVSHQALSERLRRGHEALMTNSLGIGFEGSFASDAGSDGGVTGPPLAQSKPE